MLAAERFSSWLKMTVTAVLVVSRITFIISPFISMATIV
jgi:hypothetical protein